jgi:NifU-like protein involved in Fe-S cluster formation
MTEAKARKYCEEYVMATAAAKQCGAHITLTMKTDIEGCIEDIKV